MEPYQSIREGKQSNVINYKPKKMKKTIIATFYRQSKFHYLLNEKGGNSKDFSIFTILNGCVLEVGWSFSRYTKVGKTFHGLLSTK